MRKFIVPSMILFLVIIGLAACRYSQSQAIRKTYSDYNTAVHDVQTNDLFFFKVHLKNGQVAFLTKWDLNIPQDSVIGIGTLYDFNRNVIARGPQAIAMNDVAIFETNDYNTIRSKDKSRTAALTLLTAVSVIGAIVCITTPKACFGSCPTFYTPGHTDLFSASAEGFSSSISPSLAAGDVDALHCTTPPGDYAITLKNEAWETHVIDEVSLIGVPVNAGERAYQNYDGRYVVTNTSVLPLQALSESGSILDDICAMDEQEYFSVSDSTDLSAREELVFHFDGKGIDNAGLVINFRQTLLTTFLLYNGLSYMGDEAGDYYAQIETSSRMRELLKSPFDVLGKIDVQVWNSKKKNWTDVAQLYETGPIAHNLQFVDLPDIKNEDGTMDVRIVAAKGMWRFDAISLANIAREEIPVVLPMTAVRQNNVVNKDVLGQLKSTDQNPLVTFPLDEYLLEFEVPDRAPHYELFLYSYGYYLEWMREEWLSGKNPEKLRNLLLTDKETWKSLAIEFKEAEAGMEEVFWSSKISSPQ